jgi:hypothetical protein
MNKLLLGLAALPFMAGAASATQPLSDAQMDTVTAGFGAASTADAQALGKIVSSLTATVSQVAVVTTTTGDPAVTTPVTATLGETTLTLIKALSAAASSSTATNTLPTTPLPLSANP